MKLYHFNHNGYGEEYYTVAENKTEAFNALITFFQARINDPNEHYKNSYKEGLKTWKNVNPLDASTFPKSFTLDEFEAGHIIESEIA